MISRHHSMQKYYIWIPSLSVYNLCSLSFSAFAVSCFLFICLSHLSSNLPLSTISIDWRLMKRSFMLSDTLQQSMTQKARWEARIHRQENAHTITQPSGFPPLLDEVIIARRVHASIAHSARELSIHTYIHTALRMHQSRPAPAWKHGGLINHQYTLRKGI